MSGMMGRHALETQEAGRYGDRAHLRGLSDMWAV